MNVSSASGEQTISCCDDVCVATSGDASRRDALLFQFLLILVFYPESSVTGAKMADNRDPVSETPENTGNIHV